MSTQLYGHAVTANGYRLLYMVRCRGKRGPTNPPNTPVAPFLLPASPASTCGEPGVIRNVYFTACLLYFTSFDGSHSFIFVEEIGFSSLAFLLFFK